MLINNSNCKTHRTNDSHIQTAVAIVYEEMLVCCSAGLWVVVESAIIHMQKGLSASAERPFYSCNRVCKPGSVLSDHQSLHRVATMLEHKKRSATCGYMSGKQSAYGVASDRVYMAPLVTKRTVSSYLAFPSLPALSIGGLFLLHFP